MSASGGSVKVRSGPGGRAGSEPGPTAEPVGHTAKSAPSLNRLRAFLARLDRWFADRDPSTVGFVPASPRPTRGGRVDIPPTVHPANPYQQKEAVQ